MPDWVENNNGVQAVDSNGNWIYVGDTPPDLAEIGHHFHGLKHVKIDNGHYVLVDHDACVASATPNTNFGSNVVLGVFEDAGPLYVYVYVKATGIANFSPGSALDHAFLHLKRIYTVYLGDGAGHISQIEVRRVSGGDWDESTITWNNKPAEGAEYKIIDLPAITEDTWLTIDLTDWLPNWIDGTWNNYGVVLKPVYADPIKRFHSSEATSPLVLPYFSLFYFPY